MQAEWFAGRLRELREGRGLDRDQLAGQAGIRPSAVRDLEQGRYSPNWETVVALCLALGVTPDAFAQQPAARPPIGRGRPRKAGGGERAGARPAGHQGGGQARTARGRKAGGKGRRRPKGRPAG